MMEIVKTQTSNGLLLTIRGRLDAYWADHLDKQIEEIMRKGSYQVQLNMAGVDYISSVGIGVLIKYSNQLKSMNGVLAIVELSPQVHKILAMAGLEEELLATERRSDTASKDGQVEKWRKGHADFEIYPDSLQSRLRCRVFGGPEWQALSSLTEKQVHILDFPLSTFGLGMGAIGETWEQNRERFGEFLAISGAAVYLPTDGSNKPDYLVETGTLVPRLSVLYGIVCEGPFSHQFRFNVQEDADAIGISHICQAALDITGAEKLGMILLAESNGLVGLSVRNSPLGEKNRQNPFHFPEIKKWFSFTSEPVFSRHLTLTAGVVSKNSKESWTHLLRPMGNKTDLLGHFHACAFPFQPLKKGKLELHSTVQILLNAGAPLGLHHLVADDREIIGVGESEFLRGACWVAPIEG